MARSIKGRGVFYTRDSGGKHEMTPAEYLKWANKAAHDLGVVFQADENSIAEMVRNREAVRGDVYLDYDVSGNLLSRRALDLLSKRIELDEQISHLFVPRRDRLARPNNAMDGIKLESHIRQMGVTVVFMDRTAAPLRVGQREDIGNLITSVIDYHSAGAVRRELAEKIILAQIQLAKNGYSTGGRAPYGFRRWLIKEDGTRIRELQDGERVRMAGHHVVWIPLPADHPHMQTVQRIRKLVREMPASQVVKLLNSEGIPLPDFGRSRRDLGIEHRVSGTWNQSAVLNICRSPLLAACVEHGLRSMGDQLRFTPDGSRELSAADFLGNGRPKVVRNSRESLVRAPAHFDPIESADDHESFQKILDERSKSQRGKPRSRNPERNPLGARVFDISCGWPMYRQPYQDSFRYVCGLYTQSKGCQCGHHHVDGLNATKVVVSAMVQKLLTPSGNMKLKAKLEAIANKENDAPLQQSMAKKAEELESLKGEQATVARNKARADSSAQFEAMKQVFEENRQRIEILERALREKAEKLAPTNPQQEVEKALSKLAK